MSAVPVRRAPVRPAAPSRDRTAPRGLGPPAAILTLAPALLVLAAHLWATTDPQAMIHASLLIAAIGMVHGMALFVVLGGDRISLPGYFQVGSAVIVGASGLLVAPDPYFLEVPQPDRWVHAALFAATSAQIGIGALSLRTDPPAPAPPALLPDAAALRAQLAGTLLLAGSLVLGVRLGPFLDGFGFAAILLVCVAALLSRKGLRSPLNVVLVLAGLAAYPVLVISGTGRLRAIALALAVGYLAFLRYGRRWMKTLGVLAAPVILAALGLWRREYEEAMTGQHGNDTGLSSMFVAIGNLGSLIHDSEHGLAPTLGTSLLSPLGAALPDALRPAWIPEATGYELAAFTDPELYGTGFSTVASVYGDLWWNLGLLGLVAGTPVLALLLGRIDAEAVRALQRADGAPHRLLLAVLLLALLGGVGDLVWSGFHTWIVRMYARAAALPLLGLGMLLLPVRSTPTFVSLAAVSPADDLRPAAAPRRAER
ncbi:hypothetical protein [Brachybacterium hainanense]|uniref:Uncharacterized protein n=1 Tax=Brachybacterium hainanense TaxID=1541174 RepID=A0ABV6R8B2_9MICO